MTQRQKLEIPFNQQMEIELLYDEPVSGNSSYGIYHLYAVKSNGEEYSFFPSDPVHEQLKDLNKGDRAKITKIAQQKGKKTFTEYVVDIIQNKPSQRQSQSVNTSSKEDNARKDNYYGLLLQSYQDALEIQGELNGLVDVNKIAITLFIARSKQH